MNRFIPAATDSTLLFRTSRNAEHYKADKGIFEVHYQKAERRVFHTLLEAFLFYFTIEEAAELWDKTTDSVLIEATVELCLN